MSGDDTRYCVACLALTERAERAEAERDRAEAEAEELFLSAMAELDEPPPVDWQRVARELGWETVEQMADDVALAAVATPDGRMAARGRLDAAADRLRAVSEGASNKEEGK